MKIAICCAMLLLLCGCGRRKDGLSKLAGAFASPLPACSSSPDQGAQAATQASEQTPLMEVQGRTAVVQRGMWVP